MTCSERRDSIFLFAADQLDPAEQETLRRHLASGCPNCLGALAEAEAQLAKVSMSLDPVAPSPELQGVLMSRVTDASAGSAPFEQTREALRRSRWRIWTTSILSAAAAVAITSAVFVQRQRNAMMIYPWSNVQTVALSSETQPAARAEVLWDRDKNRWRVSVFNLSPPSAGREFELWFINPDGTKHPSDTFNVDANGNATLVVSVPTDIGSIALAAITDEPIGGVPQPTGQIHLAGKVPG